MHVHTPVMTGSDCEGAGEMFRLANMGSAAGPSISSSTSLTHRQETTTASVSSSSPVPDDASPSIPQSPASSSTHSLEPFFPHPVNLTVSSQLHLECPHSCSISDLYPITLFPSGTEHDLSTLERILHARRRSRVDRDVGSVAEYCGRRNQGCSHQDAQG